MAKKGNDMNETLLKLLEEIRNDVHAIKTSAAVFQARVEPLIDAKIPERLNRLEDIAAMGKVIVSGVVGVILMSWAAIKGLLS